MELNEKQASVDSACYQSVSDTEVTLVLEPASVGIDSSSIVSVSNPAGKQSTRAILTTHFRL
jgi:hypothetical protein